MSTTPTCTENWTENWTENVDSLTADGRIVHVRALGPCDLEQLVALHERASDRSIYLRFFNLNRSSALAYAQHLVDPEERHLALGAFRRDQLIGVANYERDPAAPSAEFALLVDDRYQHEGIGTLLLEHVIAAARAEGIERFTADVLAGNSTMLQVVRDLGFPAHSRLDHGELHIEFPLDVSNQVLEAVNRREEQAGRISLQPLLRPRSVAVVGAGERAGSVGHEVLRNILDAGFPGTVRAVNPRHHEVLGVPCVADPSQLPEAVDLAVIAVPAPATLAAVQACAERGCRAAVLLGAGFGESGETGRRLQAALLTTAREHDMRLVGPNCVGISNTAARLDATFARLPRRPGTLALMTQSGAVGAAFATAADHRGLGLAQLVSVGNKSDVGGNDLLLAWEEDPDVAVIALYLESVGDPRRFARIARRVATRKPVLVLKAGRTAAAQRAGLSHTAAAALPEVAVDALFERSGVVRVETLADLVEAARVLTSQPAPTGPRVAVVGNSGGPEILATDTLPGAGLTLAELTPGTRAALSAVGLPAQSPLDLGAEADASRLTVALSILLAAPEVDAALTVFTAVAVTDIAAIRAVVAAAATSSPKPVVSVVVGEPEATIPLPGGERSLPVFTFPEPAVTALGAAYRHARVVAQGRPGPPVRPDAIDSRAALDAVRRARTAGREWLDPDECHRVLTAYGLPVLAQRTAVSHAEAAAAADELGYPVALKLGRPGIHKSEVGGVRLGLRDEADLAAAIAELGPDGTPLLLQPMAVAGVELIVGAIRDPQCGPLVMVGAGGVRTGLMRDRAFALAPISSDEAQALVQRLRIAGQLTDTAALADIVVRVGTLVVDHPEIAELDLNPVVHRPDGNQVVDARIRITGAAPTPDPLVRQLRAGPATGSG